MGDFVEGGDAMDVSLPMPIVDLEEDPVLATEKLREACTKHGFFFVSNHGVPDKVIAEQYIQSSKFFQLPEEVKNKYEAIGNRGYTGLHEQTLDPGNQKKGDTKESFYVSLPEAEPGSKEEGLPFHGANLWPKEIPEFKTAMLNYIGHIDVAYKKLLRLISDALDLPKGYFEPHFAKPLITLRPIHYTAELSDTGGGVFGAGAHTDWGFITLVETNNTPGLELCYEGTWYSVPTIPGTFVVNIGDLLQRWTNGVFKSTLHRVVNKTPGKERNSCAFFLAPQYDSKVECLPTCIGEGAKLPPVSCADYLTAKYSQTHANFTEGKA